ncbi:MAG: hypothetical protein IKO66_03220 [Paludibacteraceae bacterium]|nr:hypothetical protein [Paludibacteraceae bacterium]
MKCSFLRCASDDLLRCAGAPLFYGQNDAARCSFRSKSQVKALLHPYGTAYGLVPSGGPGWTL